VLQITTSNLLAQGPPYSPGNAPACMKYPVNTIPIHTGIDWTSATPVPYPLGANDQYWSVVSNDNGPAPMCAIAYNGACPNLAGSQKISVVASGSANNNGNVLGALKNTSVLYTFRREFWIDAPSPTTFFGNLDMDIKFDDKLMAVRVNNTPLPGISSGIDNCTTYSFLAVPVPLQDGLNSIEIDIINVDLLGAPGSVMYIDVFGSISIVPPLPPSIIRNDYFVPNTNPVWGCAPLNAYPPIPNLVGTCVTLPNTQGLVDITNFSPTYGFSVNNGFPSINASGEFIGTVGTTYIVSATDAKGCAATTSFVMASTNNPPIPILSPNQVCVPTPAIWPFPVVNVNVSGGMSPYQYSYNGGVPTSLASLSIPAPYVYSVTVIDAAGCTGTATVNAGYEYSLYITPKSTACITQGAQTTFTVASLPMVPNLQYSINGGPFSSNNIFTVNTTGTYTINAIDDFGCTSSTNFIVFPDPLPFVTTNNMDCFPTLTVNNSLPIALTTAAWSDPINQISWTPPPFNFTPQNIVPTPLPFSYTVTVTDVNGCTGTATYLYSPNPFCCDNYQNVNLAGDYFSSHPTYGNGTASAISTAFGGNTITTNAPIYLDGDILIDQSISFVNCPDIRLTYNTRLLLAPGVTLTIDQSTLQAKCGYMWKGIYANGTGNTLHITGYSLFDMQEGVVADNGATIQCTGNQFDRNYYSMQLLNAPAPYNTTAQNCIITGNSFDGVSNMLFPYNNQPKSETAIRIQNCREVQIGQLANVNGGNNFNGGYNGIHIVPGANTQLESYYLYNNLFWSMYETVNSSTTDLYYKVNAWSTANHRGAGVYCKPMGSTPSPNHHLYIEADQEDFQFNRCDRAVCAFETGADIKGNTVKSCLMGFMFPLAKNHKYTIQNNSLAGNQWSNTGFLDYGVIGIRFLGGTSFAMVQNNGIDMGPYAGVSNQGAKIFPVAIDLIGTGGGTSTMVMENTISLQKPSGCGISVRNFSSGVDLYQNTIGNYSNGLTGDPTYVSAGIFCENAQRVKIRGNNINGNNDLLINPNAYDAIRMSASTDCLVECNETYATRRGLRVYSNCSTGMDRVRGNTFDTHGYAMEFNDLGTQGTLGEVGSPTYDCRNNFYNSALFPPNTYGIFRNVTIPLFQDQIYTTYCPATYSWSDQPGGVDKYNLWPNPGVQSYTCPQSMYQMLGEQNGGGTLTMQQALEIALDSIEYPQLHEGVSWMEKQRLFNALSGPDSNLLSNTELAQFYSNQMMLHSDELRTVNILLQSLRDSIVYQDSIQYEMRLQEMETLNNSIAGNHSLEINEKVMNQLIIRWFREGLDSLSSADSLLIDNLANSCPFVNGYGVYKARMLMHTFGSYSNWSDKSHCNAAGLFKNEGAFEEPVIHKDLLKAKGGDLVVYPNPFGRELNLEFDDSPPSPLTFHLFDISGREVYQGIIQGSSRREKLKIPFLKPGVYLYRVETSSGEGKYFGKLIKE